MKIIRPSVIADANLISSTVPETDYAAFNAATAYAQGDRVVWAVSGSHRIYEALSAHTGKHPKIASASLNLITIGSRLFTVDTGLGIAGGEAVEVTAADDPTATMTGTVSSYTSGTGALVLNITAVTGGGLHAAWIIKRPGLWLELGATNRWLMFDGSITSQTTQADSLSVTVSVTDRVDSVALLNVSAATARVRMIDATDGVVYDQTQSLVSTLGIADWYAWFFEPTVRKPEVVFSGLPPYIGAQVEITLTNIGGVAACGAAVVGLSRELGRTQCAPSLGIQDYSLKTRDDFGNYTVLERAFNKTGRFSLIVSNDQVDEVHRLLATYRATPIVYVGSDLYPSSLIYGFYKDFALVISYPTFSICDIEIEGLT